MFLLNPAPAPPPGAFAFWDCCHVSGQQCMLTAVGHDIQRLLRHNTSLAQCTCENLSHAYGQVLSGWSIGEAR